jgi:hypothetical protein
MPTFQNYINKAFEVEIQNKIKPCIVEKPVHHSISWKNMKIIKLTVECLALWGKMCK